ARRASRAARRDVGGEDRKQLVAAARRRGRLDLTTTSTGTFAPATTYVVTDATGSADVRTPNAADATIDGEPIPAGAFVFEG
ncbi:hypothetical protein ACEQ6A_35605, partial [Rhizobium brockwellii]|uniref:hypothetical protein n=1 Tax=Rhizobium brockwellii TaxID=3019932 RepID=UPI003F9B05E0